MLGQFVEHVSGRSNGIGAEIEFQTGLFGGGDETVGGGLVSRDVHVASALLVVSIDIVDVGCAAVGVVPKVITGLDDADVSFGYFGLLGKFLAQEVKGYLDVAAVEPAHESEGEHVAALEH